MRNIIIILVILITSKSIAQDLRQIQVGKYKEYFEIPALENFSILGDWKIIHREWVKNCQQEIMIGDTLFIDPHVKIMNDYMHLDECIKIEKSSIFTYSSLFPVQYPYIRFRKGYWSINEFVKFDWGNECIGDYFLNKFGNKQLVVEGHCYFDNPTLKIDTIYNKYMPNYTAPHDGISFVNFFVLNNDLIMTVKAGSIIYLKRDKKLASYKKDGDGNRIVQGNGRNLNFSILLNDFNNDAGQYLKLTYSSNLKLNDKKAFQVKKYITHYCDNFNKEISPKTENIYFNSYIDKNKQLIKPSPSIIEHDTIVYIPFKILTGKIADISISNNYLQNQDFWTIKFINKSVIEKKVKINNTKLYNGEFVATQELLKKYEIVKIIDTLGDWCLIEYKSEIIPFRWIKSSDIQ